MFMMDCISSISLALDRPERGSQGSDFAIDPFKQQEIHCDEGMDLHAGLQPSLSNFKRLTGSI